MDVGDRFAITRGGLAILSCVSCDLIFTDRPVDLAADAARLEHGQTFNRDDVLVGIVRINFDVKAARILSGKCSVFRLCSIFANDHGMEMDLLFELCSSRSLAVLVAAVFPDLCDLDLGVLRSVAVGDCNCTAIACNSLFNYIITFLGVLGVFTHCFFNTVGDLLAVFHYRQILPDVAPAIRCANFDGIANFCSCIANSLVQLYLRIDVFTLAILVASIRPRLCDFELGYFRCVAVGDFDRAAVALDSFNTIRLTVAALDVLGAIRQSLDDEVSDLLAVFLDRQVIPSGSPSVFRIAYGHFFADSFSLSIHALEELYCCVRRSLAVLVALVIPGLFNRYLGRLRNMFVREIDTILICHRLRIQLLVASGNFDFSCNVDVSLRNQRSCRRFSLVCVDLLVR